MGNFCTDKSFLNFEQILLPTDTTNSKVPTDYFSCYLPTKKKRMIILK